ncbi:carboxypeptidase-like regulatory domain-containing protein [Williamwhitmania taraxaci]|uniref:CarboxypepD_reg-like domain-containing protein n=1 Tax=Williamwhitmania taraxaci TaxID=1640674 RepID=A0A1G6JQF7_9BACT|nr:carboxypeptidase-like regulatory domain-containing protein [Williamwhitmania taraxaci]SDC20980.1 CarboxypepD_reg-like domain-containing protein [Williamwhitmania taraxaci]
MINEVTRKQRIFNIFNAVGPRLLVLLLFLCITIIGFAQKSPLDQRVTIESKRVTLYEALNLISDQIGYNFVYDSKDLDSDRKVKLEAKNDPVLIVLSGLLNRPNLAIKVLDKYILIYRVALVSAIIPVSPTVDSIHPFIVKGRVFDKETKELIPYATVGVVEQGIGTITNLDGFFVMKVPSKQLISTLTISHLGYKSQTLPVELLSGQQVDIYLEPHSISIQEVIIRNVDPQALVEKAMAQISHNYGETPAFLTSFYREGVVKNSDFLSYSEAVFKVYKSPYTRSPEMDQVKLLKSRKIRSGDQRDTLIVKMKAGISASLSLDIVKSIPEFLDKEYMINYRYTRSDIVTLDSLTVYAISFEQQKGIIEPFFKGVLYITMDSLAILGADFEINPEFVEKSGSQLVVKKSSKIKVIPTKVAYSVRYKHWNGKYYLSHIRGDLYLKVKMSSRLFSSNYHVFLEMATIQIELGKVTRFPRSEIINSRAVFSDLDFTYDDEFWREFNFIAPEASLLESMRRIAPIIENMEGTN